MNMYPTLKYIAETYFHQDYDLEADSPAEVVELFRETESPEMAATLSGELEELTESPDLTEERLAELWLEEYGAYYDPRAAGMSVRDWLNLMAEKLS
jgi:hypothetical protein